MSTSRFQAALRFPLQIHTSRMSTNSFLGRDVDLAELAARTKNFSGAEIEGLVKSATSFALNRQVGIGGAACKCMRACRALGSMQ